MIKTEAIDVLEEMKAKCNDTFHGVRYATREEALEMGILALKLISTLNNRPCEACEFHGENGCREWECVFDEWFKAQYKARKEQNDRTL